MTRIAARNVAPVLLALAWLEPGSAAPAPQPTPAAPVRKAAGPPDQFKALQSQARAAKAPGPPSSGDANALLLQLTRKHQANLEAGNARARARFDALGSPPTTGGGAASANIGVVLPDPCGTSFELKAIATAPPLEPGEYVALEGCGFGSNPPGGEVRLVGDFGPGVGSIKLEVSGWGRHRILARVPMVTGVNDLASAKIQVFRQDGKFSNWVDVGFRATREVVRLRPSDVNVLCGDPYQQPECSLASSHPSSESQFFGGATFAGKHRVDASVIDCDDPSARLNDQRSRSADDTFNVGLRNGWVLAGSAWVWGLDGQGYVRAPAGFVEGSNSSTISMTWGIWSMYCPGPRHSAVSYRVDLYAVGPKGVPYK